MNRIVDAIEQAPDRDYGAVFDFLLSARYNLPDETKLYEFLLNFYREAGVWPSRGYIQDRIGIEFSEVQPPLTPEDLLDLVKTIERERGRLDVIQTLSESSMVMLEGGQANEVYEIVSEKFKAMFGVADPIRLSSANETSVSDLMAKKRKANGYQFYVEELDEMCRGLEAGTVVTLAGFVGAFKTTSAISIAVNNAIGGRSTAIVTLETPPAILKMQALSNYSFSPHWPGTPIPYLNILKRSLDDATLKDLAALEAQFNELPGKLYMVGADAFLPDIVSSMNPAVRRLADDGVEALFIDHVQLLKYYAESRKDEPIVNRLVRGITSSVMEAAERGHDIRAFLLSQINREAYKKALRKGGRYDLSCLAEFSELERSSAYVVTQFCTDELKSLGELRVQLIKHRFGPTLEEPFTISINPHYAVVGGMSTIDSMADVSPDNLADFLGDHFDL